MSKNKSYGSSLYNSDQVRRVLDGAGINIEKELDTDFIIFCPYHNNFRTPAGEVSKTKGTFLCFSCHTTRDLVSFIKEFTNRTYFESLRFISSKGKNIDIEKEINKSLINVY
jgi:DNA primase